MASENPNVPLGTKIRNVNCAFVSYGKDIDIFDNGLLLFLIEYIKKRWMAIYYSKLGKYIGMNENENKDKDDRELHLVNPEKNALKDDELIVERTNYICVKFITLDNIRNFMVKFIKARQSEWDDIYDFLEYIARDLSVNIENKILTAIAN